MGKRNKFIGPKVTAHVLFKLSFYSWKSNTTRHALKFFRSQRRFRKIWENKWILEQLVVIIILTVRNYIQRLRNQRVGTVSNFKALGLMGYPKFSNRQLDRKNRPSLSFFKLKNRFVDH